MEEIMPLSDLFKKSPKQEPPKRPSQDDVFGSPALQKNRVDAATEVMGIFDRHFRNPLHPGTVLSTAAWLAGTSLYRSFGYTQNPEPGTVMLSEKANQEFPKLINLFHYYMFQGGVQMKMEQFILQIPDEHKPLKTILQIQDVHQDEYNAIMKRHGLDYLDGARAGIIVCSMVFGYHTQRKEIDTRVGAGIVSMGIVTGAKTAPMPLKPQGAPPIPATENHVQNAQLIEVLKSIAANSTSGSGARLVLGEGVIPMQEALSKGGKYVLVHPAVMDKLKQNNIDPYLVYEMAMRIEIESRIPRIDLAGGNVDELLRNWSGKPQDQVPVHVRQILWLNTNANNLRYQRNGNSWVFKQ
jgi:hypothetical protein